MQEDFATKVEKLWECAAEIKGLEELQGVYYDFKMARLYGTRPVNVGAVALGTHPESFQFDLKKIGFTSMSRDNSTTLSFTEKKRAVVAKWGLGGDCLSGAGCPPSWLCWIQLQDASSTVCRRLVTLTTFSTMPNDD